MQRDGGQLVEVVAVLLGEPRKVQETPPHSDVGDPNI